ncbi:MAG TPA: lipoprotein-releasing ABC transporter permease subunit, partial [Dongiaceae bacterium]|nr:lipoprotein-releasing ABC transporter permease subunit [Dongiaceae bacterium]
SRRQARALSFTAIVSLIGIGLGVGVLIIVMSVMNGLRADLLSRILGVDPQVWVERAEGSIDKYAELAKQLSTVPGVVHATPVIDGEAMFVAAERSIGVKVRGITPEDLAARSGIAGNIIAGDLKSFGGATDIVVGADLARRFGLHVDQEVTLISPDAEGEGTNAVPRSQGFRIIAIFETRDRYDLSLVYVPLAAAQQYYRLPDGVNGIDLTVKDPQQAPTIAAGARQALGEGYRVRDWQELNASFVSALKVERIVTFILLTLVVLVAAFNIISGQIMLVKDKGREIAILRTMGATRPAILRIFVLSGASIGVFGTIVGLALGLSIAGYIDRIGAWLLQFRDALPLPALVDFLAQLPSIINPWEVTAVVVMALCLSLLATVYPAWRAARLDPVEALRYE